MSPSETLTDRIYSMLVGIRLTSARPKLTADERELVQGWLAEAEAADPKRDRGELVNLVAAWLESGRFEADGTRMRRPKGGWRRSVTEPEARAQADAWQKEINERGIRPTR